MNTGFDRRRKDRSINAVLDAIHGTLIPPGADYGQIHRNEAEFLVNLVLAERPENIVEIGTAAGVSTSYILSAMELGGLKGSLTALECLDHCYFDPTKKPGFIIDALYPVTPERFALRTNTDSFMIGSIFEECSIDFLFIDGNHSHPWATIDTILALPFLVQGATVVFHDINLHYRGGERKRFDKGPHYLFYNLFAADKKVVGEFPYPNIGSLRMVASPEIMIEKLLELLFRFPWEPRAWPSLDVGILTHLEKFIGLHWGHQVACNFTKGIERNGQAEIHGYGPVFGR